MALGGCLQQELNLGPMVLKTQVSLLFELKDLPLLDNAVLSLSTSLAQPQLKGVQCITEWVIQ